MPGQTQPRADANLDNISLLTLAAAAASTNGSDQNNPFNRGVSVVVDITNITGSGASLIITIEGKDPVSGKYYPLLASAALTVVGTTVLRVYPTVPAAANLAAQLPLPKTWRVRATIAGTTPSVTATVNGALHI